MAVLTAVRAVFSATVEIPDAALQQHSPFSPRSIGGQLAQKIDENVRAQALGYYPALDYFQHRGVLDGALLEALEQLAWLGSTLVREQVRQRLRPFFASVQIQSMQLVVYSMPPVRPSQNGALESLARHLTPNRAKFDLLLTLLRKNAGNEHLDSYIERVAYRHLSDLFVTIDVGGVKILEQDG